MHVPHAALARALVATVAALVLQAPAPAQAVHYVDATGNGAFVDVQSAVDAAADGDVVLVRRP